MLFRFLEYDYLNDEDMYSTAKYICAINVENNYDVFYRMLTNHIGKDIILMKDEWYTIDDIILRYGGNDEEDRFCVNVYLTGY